MEVVDKIEAIKQWLGTESINIFGIQFSGKDTVAMRLASELDAVSLSSGDVMRHTFAGDRDADEDVKKASEIGSLTGALMPTNEFQRMMIRRLAEPDLDGKPIILSSVGRWIGEEQPILQALSDANHATKAVILLEISEETAWRRWASAKDHRNGGRHDDMDESVVAKRIEEYKAKTLPVIDTYRNMGILLPVDGEQSKEAVYSSVVDALYEFSLAT